MCMALVASAWRVSSRESEVRQWSTTAIGRSRTVSVLYISVYTMGYSSGRPKKNIITPASRRTRSNSQRNTTKASENHFFTDRNTFIVVSLWNIYRAQARTLQTAHEHRGHCREHKQYDKIPSCEVKGQVVETGVEVYQEEITHRQYI